MIAAEEVGASERASRLCLGAALLVPCLLLISQGGTAAAFGALAAVSVPLSTRRSRPRLLTSSEEAIAQLVLLLLAVGLFAAAVRGLGEPASFGRYLTVAMLALSVPRAAFVPTRAGRVFTLAFGQLALMGMAKAVDRWTFGAGTLVYLVAGLLSVLQAEPGFGSLLRHRRGLLLPFALATTLAGGIMGFLAWGLPAAEPAVTEYLGPWLGEGQTTSGYADGPVDLKRMSEILTSDEVMLRLEPAQVQRLRGQVYREYRGGEWRPLLFSDDARRTGPEGHLAWAEAHDAPRLEIEVAGRLGRTVFLPDEAQAMEGLPALTELDAYGRGRTASGEEPERYRVAVGREPALPIAPPTEADTALPWGRAKGTLERIAIAWGLRDPGLRPRQALGRIASKLAEFRYSLVFDEEATQSNDPIVDFLERTQSGHCELFATAFVLLARTVNVPARFVAGFRVVEQNAVGGYAVVRGRDAHAWAEVFVDGRWQVFDPTPAGGLEEVRGTGAGPFGQRLDVVFRALGRAFLRLQNLSAGELVSILALIVALVGLFVWLRRRGRAAGAADLAGGGDFEPLLTLEAFLAARHAQPRPQSRTLAAHAERLRGAGLAEAADLLDACADLRYGGVGDEAELRRRVAALVGTRYR